LGGFAGYQAARRRLNDAFASKGESESPYLGAYAVWQHEQGWYADGVLQAQYNDSNFEVNDSQGSDRAKFAHAALGASLELGKSWQLWETGLKLTPSAQIAWTRAQSDTTTTDRMIRAHRDALDTIRWAFSGSLAREFALPDGHFVQPEIRIGYEEQNSYGGALDMEYATDHRRMRPNSDGHRVVVGAGVTWRVSANQQIHLDYERAWGNKYDTPWALNASYRVRF
jgi:outer membrane autotransporter protein